MTASSPPTRRSTSRSAAPSIGGPPTATTSGRCSEMLRRDEPRARSLDADPDRLRAMRTVDSAKLPLRPHLSSATASRRVLRRPRGDPAPHGDRRRGGAGQRSSTAFTAASPWWPATREPSLRGDGALHPHPRQRRRDKRLLSRPSASPSLPTSSSIPYWMMIGVVLFLGVHAIFIARHAKGFRDSLDARCERITLAARSPSEARHAALFRRTHPAADGDVRHRLWVRVSRRRSRSGWPGDADPARVSALQSVAHRPGNDVLLLLRRQCRVRAAPGHPGGRIPQQPGWLLLHAGPGARR